MITSKVTKESCIWALFNVSNHNKHTKTLKHRAIVNLFKLIQWHLPWPLRMEYRQPRLHSPWWPHPARDGLCRQSYHFQSCAQHSKRFKNVRKTDIVYIQIIFTMPLMTFPKTTWRPSNQGVCFTVMKNWDPLVSLPALAMDSHPAPKCFSLKFSSSKRSP